MHRYLIINIIFYFLLSGQFVGAEEVELKIGIHPLHSPQRLYKVFEPLTAFINKNAKSFKLKLEVSKDYAQYNMQIKEGYFDIISPNPYQTIKAEKLGYRVIGKWGNDQLFKGIILVRNDSLIDSIEKINGKQLAFPAPTALAGTLMPKYLLFKNKLRPEKDYKAIYTGNQESAILAAYNKTADVAVTWYPPWNGICKDRPEICKSMKIIAETESLPNNSVMIKSKIPKVVENEFTSLLFSLHKSNEGIAILNEIGIPHFEYAKSETYMSVREFIKQYEGSLGPIPW